MTTIDDMSALEAAMDQEAIAREIRTLEARVQSRQGSSPREMQGMQARLTALREDLHEASDGPPPQQQQQPSATSNLQQPRSAASYLQQPSATSNLQQPSVMSNLQQSSAASNLQQPSAASNLQQPSAAANLQPNNDTQLRDIMMDLEQLLDVWDLQTLSPNWPVASRSPANTANAAGTAAPAGGHQSLSAMITAVNDMQKRLFGSLPEDPKSVDSRPASPHSPFAFKSDDIVPIPSRVNLAWHRDVTSEHRKHLIKRLIQTLISTSELPSILDRHAYHMMLYSKNVESNFFDAAESKPKYYHLMAEKIYRLQIEFAEKGQKPKERAEKTGQPLQTGTAAVPVQVNTQPNCTQVDSVPRQQRPRQTASSRINPLQIPQRRRQSPGVQMTPDQPQTLSLQVNSLLAPDQQQQLQQWYTKQRLLLFDRQLKEQTVPSSSRHYYANDFS